MASGWENQASPQQNRPATTKMNIWKTELQQLRKRVKTLKNTCPQAAKSFCIRAVSPLPALWQHWRQPQ